MSTNNQEFFEDLEALRQIEECAVFVPISDFFDNFEHPALPRIPFYTFVLWLHNALPRQHYQFSTKYLWVDKLQVSIHLREFLFKHIDIIQELVAIQYRDVRHQRAEEAQDPRSYNAEYINL